MYRLALIALILAGCGGHHHHASPPPPPAPAPFADIAGTYAAVVTFKTGQPYDGHMTVGDTYTVTVTPAGKVTAVEDATGGVATYTLTRLADGTFLTLKRSVVGSLWEYGTAPADLSAFHLNSYNVGGTHYGMADLTLVKASGG